MQEYKIFSLGKFPAFLQKAILPVVHFCFNAGPNSAQSTIVVIFLKAVEETDVVL